MRIDLSFGDDDASSDDDPTIEPTTEPKWKRLEQDIRDLCESASDRDEPATAQWNVVVPGQLSGTNRQVYVLVTGSVGGEDIRIAVECKNYKRPVGIKTVEAFIGMLLDLDVHKGAMYAANGFTANACQRAAKQRHPHLKLYDVDVARLAALDYSDLIEDSCPNPNCFVGYVSFREWRDNLGQTLEFGSCGFCGTEAVRCPNCGSVTGFVWDHDQACDGCEAEFTIVRDRKGSETEGLVMNLNRSESEFVRST
jgi:hypothetical protein